MQNQKSGAGAVAAARAGQQLRYSNLPLTFNVQIPPLQPNLAALGFSTFSPRPARHALEQAAQQYQQAVQRRTQILPPGTDLANWSRLPSRPARQVLEQAAQQLQQAAQKAAQARAAGLRPGQGAAGGGGAGGGPAVQFVSGKSFYLNAGRWIDSEIQTLQTLKTKTKKIPIKFGSPEYFKLVTDKPAVLKWISLGKHVEFVLDGIHYEIYEDTKTSKPGPH